MIDQLTLVKQRSDLFGAGTFQLVVAEMLERGLYDAHLRTLRAAHAERYAAMTTALESLLPRGTLTWSPVTGGIYLWAHARPSIDAQRLAQRALDAGLALVSGDVFFPDGAGWHDLRLCFARNPAPVIATGVERLTRLLTTTEARPLHEASTHPLM